MTDNQLRVLSFNCWALKFFSKNRTERIPAIAAKLARSDYDIIVLQELWVYADYEYVKESVASRLPHAKFFYSGALGSGLAIFSRFPILETSLHPYSLNGAPIDVAAGDWFVGKAAASVLIRHPVLGLVQIFNTHLFAKGGEDGPEHLRAHRLVNAWEFARLVRRAAESGRYVIAAGDFNSIPLALPMAIIRDYAALKDCWAVSRRNDPSTSNDPPPLSAVRKFGITADSPINTYSASKPLDRHALDHFGKRLDYIFYRQPTIKSTKYQTIPKIQCVQSKVVITDIVPGYNFSYSDHFGLEATLDFSGDNDDDHDGDDDDDDDGQMPSDSPTLSPANISTTIHALNTCYRFSSRRSSKELAIFCICIATLFVLVVSSAWVPPSWVSTVVLLFAIFISWLATTMLYQGFVYGRWERNALMNAIEDMEIYHSVVESRAGLSSAWS